MSNSPLVVYTKKSPMNGGKRGHVSHNGKHWISTIPANTYEPGVYGLEEAE